MNYGDFADIEIAADEFEERASVYQSESFPVYKPLIRSIRGCIVTAAVLLLTLSSTAYGAKQKHSYAQDTIARVLYIEAKGEPEEGMRGTAAVMYYRGKGKTAKIAAAVASTKWNGKYGQHLLKTVRPKGSAWARAKRIAREIVTGCFEPPFQANLVHSTEIAKPSDWDGAVHVATVGNQAFYYARRIL